MTLRAHASLRVVAEMRYEQPSVSYLLPTPISAFLEPDPRLAPVVASPGRATCTGRNIMITCVPPSMEGVYVFALLVPEQAAAIDQPDRSTERHLIVRDRPSATEDWVEIVEATSEGR